MATKPRHKQDRKSPNGVSWRWLAIVGALLLIVGGTVVWSLTRNRPAVTPQAVGAPKLVVDQTTVDEGYVQFNVPVRTTFRLSNGGDQPLTIVDQPMVELVEGC